MIPTRSAMFWSETPEKPCCANSRVAVRRMRLRLSKTPTYRLVVSMAIKKWPYGHFDDMFSHFRPGPWAGTRLPTGWKVDRSGAERVEEPSIRRHP